MVQTVLTDFHAIAFTSTANSFNHSSGSALRNSRKVHLTDASAPSPGRYRLHDGGGLVVEKLSIAWDAPSLGRVWACPAPSPPAEKATAGQDQAGKTGTDDGAGDKKLGSDFTTHLVLGVYIK